MLNDEIEILKDCYVVYISDVKKITVNQKQRDLEFVNKPIKKDFVSLIERNSHEIVLLTDKYMVYNPNNLNKTMRCDEEVECVILLRPKQDSHI